jgi:hypothetical protein
MALINGCQCKECRKLPDGVGHWSDCAVHNEPADPNGECNCSLCRINPLYTKLAQIAYDTILQTMLEGEAKHGDEWLHKSIDYHKLHAYQHAEQNYIGDKSEKHTNNGLTRNAMILYLEGEGK